MKKKIIYLISTILFLSSIHVFATDKVGPGENIGANTINGNQKTLICDIGGDCADVVCTPDGICSLNEHDADFHQDLWNHYFVRDFGASSTLDGAANKGDTDIDVVDATDMIVGDLLDLRLGTQHVHMYRTITVVSTNNLTLDAPIDFDLTNGSEVIESSFNMNVVGTLSNPVIFNIPPNEDQIIHIRGFLISMVHESAGDNSKFGSRAALTNGVVIRVNRNNGESYETLTIWKTNSDLRADMFNVDYTDKAGAGDFGTDGRWTLFERMGIIRLDGANNDVVEMLIQDDMTLASQMLIFNIKSQGHGEGE